MRAGLLVMIIVGLLFVPSTGTVAAQNTVCWIYEIEVAGQIYYGGYEKPFEQVGYLAITTDIANSVNGNNMIVILGQPSTDPSAGALAFVSNAYFIGSLREVYRSGALDLATVESWTSEAGSSVFEATIPDDATSNYGINQGLMGNIFNIGNGVTAGPKLVTGGSMWAQFWENGKVDGSIGFAGRDWTSHRSDIGYVAEITGQYLTESSLIEDCVITSR